MLFGGCNGEKILKDVHYYNTKEGEGKFEGKSALAKTDFFQVNGAYVHHHDKLIFAGHNTYHQYNTATKVFECLEI